MKSYNPREIRSMLNEKGYTYVRSKGGHDIFKKGSESVCVPIRLKPMTAMRIVRECGLEG